MIPFVPRSYVQEARRRVGPKKGRIGPIIDRLAVEHADAAIALRFRSPLELLVSVMLSAQTTDVNVNRVTRTLFDKYRSPEDYLAVPQEELERDIFATGFYRQKTKALRGTMKMLLEEFDGEVPTRLEEWSGCPASRARPGTSSPPSWASRRGSSSTRTYGAFHSGSGSRGKRIREDRARPRPARAAPRLGSLSHLLIWHGRRVCIARSPHCEDCVLNDLCPASRV